MANISTVTEADLAELLPLMRGYCDFYSVAPSDAALRDTIVFPGTDVAAGEILIGAIHGGSGIMDRLRPLDALA